MTVRIRRASPRCDEVAFYPRVSVGLEFFGPDIELIMCAVWEPAKRFGSRARPSQARGVGKDRQAAVCSNKGTR
jgi:hypothetical protein